MAIWIENDQTDYFLLLNNSQAMETLISTVDRSSDTSSRDRSTLSAARERASSFQPPPDLLDLPLGVICSLELSDWSLFPVSQRNGNLLKSSKDSIEMKVLRAEK